MEGCTGESIDVRLSIRLAYWRVAGLTCGGCSGYNCGQEVLVASGRIFGGDRKEHLFGGVGYIQKKLAYVN